MTYDYEELKIVHVAQAYDELVSLVTSLGKTSRERINTAIGDVIEHSTEDNVEMSSELSNIIAKIKEVEFEIFKSEDLWARRERGAE